jgi:predicted Zn-dependent protease
MLSLKFSRGDESEADLVGMEIAARAGYDPRAAISLWQKMGKASKGAPPQWLSSHPTGATRIADLQRNLPRVMPLYERTTAKR